jgi:hypothetical protein
MITMSDSEDLKILAEEIVDFCNGLEALAVKLRTQINKLFGHSQNINGAGIQTILNGRKLRAKKVNLKNQKM